MYQIAGTHFYVQVYFTSTFISPLIQYGYGILPGSVVAPFSV